MMKSLARPALLSVAVLLTLASGRLPAQEMVDIPAPEEWIFLNVVEGPLPFGSRQLVFATEFAVTNPAEEDAFVSIELFGPAGVRISGPGVNVAAGSLRRISLLPPDAPLFAGWARVRANQRIHIVQRLRWNDPDRGQTFSVFLTGSPKPHLNAQFPAVFDYGTNPVDNTGISVVNPSAEPIVVVIALLGHRLNEQPLLLSEKEVTIPPWDRFNFVALDFFRAVLDEVPCRFECPSGLIRISAKGTRRFAAQTIRFSRGFDGAPTLFMRPEQRYDPVGFEQISIVEDSEAWGFPTPLVASGTLGDWKLRLTPYLLQATRGESDVFLLPLGGFELMVNADLGVAVAAGEREKLVIFEEGQAPLRLSISGSPWAIREIPARGGVEIETVFSPFPGILAPAYNYVLIERATGQVVERFVALDLETPPWR